MCYINDISDNMTKLKSRILGILIIIALFSPVMAVAGDRVTVGVRGGFTTTHDAPVAGLFLQYRFSGHFRLAADVDYYFKHNGVDAFAFNIDAHAPFTIVPGKLTVYPLVGASLTSWNLPVADTESDDDSSSRRNRVGINVGGGVEYRLTENTKIGFEAKYSAVRHYDGGIFSLSLGYCF